MTRTPSPTRSAERWFTVVDGVRLRQLRRQHGLSPAELAGKAESACRLCSGWNASPGLRAGRAPRPDWPPRWASLRPRLTCSQPPPGHAAR